VPPAVDVVIVAYNRFDLTRSCLEHLAAQTIVHSVIVVDNGSTDDTSARIHREWPEIHLARLDDSRGFAAACNHGVAAGTGEFVVILNNDVDCRPDFLERLVEPLAQPDVGSVASLMLRPGGELIDGMGLTADTVLSGFPRLQGLRWIHAHDVKPVLLGAGGSAGAYRRAAWEQVGGLDERITAYMEDFDLAVRLRLAGWSCVAEPAAVGVHLGSATAGYRSKWQRRQAGFGRGYVIRRYGLLRRSAALRTLATELVVVLGDLFVSHDLHALRGRLAGWRAGRFVSRLPPPPPECLDASIGFWDSLAMRRGVYARRAA
jgi:N-acetylglucosaminyl-diphospho-decaprenol L-rhamnosyltransferase